MNTPWRLFVAALHFGTRGSVPPRAAARLVPLAGIVVGAAGAGVYVFHIRTLEVAARLDITQQLTEICFYLGALATWTYI
jgi:hypothetical protein